MLIFLRAFLPALLFVALSAGAFEARGQDPANVAPDAPSPRDSYAQGLDAYAAGEGQKALEIWSAMARRDSPLALYGLGKLYETGAPDLPRDEAAAAEWYRKASSAGVAAAMNNLGLQYLEGRGVPSDPVKAVALWRDAATLGHPYAQYNLALAYLRGNGISKDPAQAAQWFLSAARRGIVDAQYASGEVYRLGIGGVAADAGVALSWYRKAGERGHEEARLQAQNLEIAGVTPRDVDRAPPIATDGPEPDMATAVESTPRASAAAIPAATQPRPADRPVGVPSTPAAATPGPSRQATGAAAAGKLDDLQVPPAPKIDARLSASAPAGQGARAPALPASIVGPASTAGYTPGLWLGTAKNQRDAQQLWQRLVRQLPDLLQPRYLVVEETELNGLGQIYRVVAAGWSDQDQAVQDCFAMRRAAPAMFCSPVTLE